MDNIEGKRTKTANGEGKEETDVNAGKGDNMWETVDSGRNWANYTTEKVLKADPKWRVGTLLINHQHWRLPF